MLSHSISWSDRQNSEHDPHKCTTATLKMWGQIPEPCGYSAANLTHKKLSTGIFKSSTLPKGFKTGPLLGLEQTT